MEDTTRQVADGLASCALTLGVEWDDYGKPTAEDFVVVLDSVIEHLDGFEGPVAMEMPSTRVKVDRDDQGLYTVYLRVGSIERNDNGLDSN